MNRLMRMDAVKEACLHEICINKLLAYANGHSIIEVILDQTTTESAAAAAAAAAATTTTALLMCLDIQ